MLHNRRSVSLVAGLAFGLLANAVFASVQPSGGVAVRDWKTPVTTLAIPIAFDVPSSTPSKLPGRFPGFGDLHVKVNIVLDGECKLRTGEKESFVIEGTYKPAPTSSGSAKVSVRLAPSGVCYAYQDLESFNFTRSVEVWGSSGDYEVTFRLTARGRMATTPPNTISEILLTAPEDGSKMNMSWKDAGNDAQVPTAYSWAVYEKRWWWSNVLVAKGETSLDTLNVGSVVITPSSESLASPGKFFVNNKQYVLQLQLKRTSNDYHNRFSDPYNADFRYRTVAGGMAEKIITPLGHLVGLSRDLVRALNFGPAQ